MSEACRRIRDTKHAIHLVVVGLAVFSTACLARDEAKTPAVPTFHCIGLYWPPAGGHATKSGLTVAGCVQRASS